MNTEDKNSVPVAKRAPATDAQIDAYAKWNAEFFETHGRIPERIEIWNAAPQPPQNAADHIVDANKKVDAQSVPVAKVGLGIGMMAHCIRWTDMEAMGRLPIGTVLYAQAPHPEAQSVRDLTKLSYELSNALLDLENGCFDDTSMRKITLVRDELIAASQAQQSDSGWHQDFIDVLSDPHNPKWDAQSVRDAWISVDDRLPEIIEMYPGSGTGNSDPVLVYLDDENDEGEQIAIWRCFRGGQGDTTTIYWDWKTPKVTHWMPLPADPK